MMWGLNGLNKHKCVCVSVCVCDRHLYSCISEYLDMLVSALWQAGVCCSWRLRQSLHQGEGQSCAASRARSGTELFLHLLLSFVSLGNTALTCGQWQLHDIALISLRLMSFIFLPPFYSVFQFSLIHVSVTYLSIIYLFTFILFCRLFICFSIILLLSWCGWCRFHHRLH